MAADPVGSISGVVLDESGDPIEYAGVYAEGDDVNGWGSCDTGTDGSYTITGLPSGNYRVDVYAEGYIHEYYDNVYGYGNATPVPVIAPDDTPGIDFNLSTGGSISGVVMDEAGDPIEYAWVYAEGDDVNGWGSCDTGADGSYTITELRSGSYRVDVYADGYIHEYYDNVYDYSDATPVSVTEPDDTPGINFNLSTGGSISGVVLDEAGDPIQDAWIYAEGADVDGWGYFNTGADGSYTITGLRSGSYLVEVEADGYLNEYYDDVYDYGDATPVSVTEPDDTPGIDFTLGTGGSISGVVLDEAGDPIQDALVYAEGYDIDGWGYFNTGADGIYIITGLRSGSYLVEVDADGYINEYYDDVFSYGDATLVSVTVPDDTPGIDFTLAEETTTVLHDLTMAVSGSGSTSPAVGTHTYDEGVVVDITATAEAGWYFVNWTGDVTDPSSASTTVSMNADKTVTANFTNITHDLTMAVSGSGSTSPVVGTNSYVEGDVVHITATAEAGWYFVNWTGGVASPNSASTTVTIDGDKTVTANFTNVSHDLTMAVSGSGSTSPAVGAHTYGEGAVVNIIATPNSGYEFDSWAGGVADPDSASTTVTMDAAQTVTANFTQITHDLTIAVSGSGSTTPATGVHTYNEGDVVDITAEPDSGWEFDSWTGNVADPDSASTTVIMDGDKTVTANFTEETKDEESDGCFSCSSSNVSANELAIGWGIIGLCWGGGYYFVRRSRKHRI